ncbi:MAG: ParB/RepB/Spo0J family partition protein [Chloroflexi bacterium]|nr:ParB/RepB/Spo0J family partition protein [Chloroflexota bacterium]
MSRNRPDILAARATARPLQRLNAHLAGDAAETGGLREVPIDELWLRHQPRKLVPDAVLDRLLAEDRAQPRALLTELQALAEREPQSPYRAILDGLNELAATIRVHGVLVPIRLARLEGRYVVEEGHRRSLASLLAGLDRIPAVVASTASELLLAARQFVANDQRTDLSALEKAAWLRDLLVKADRELRARKGWPLDEPSFSSLFEGAEDEAADERPRPPARERPEAEELARAAASWPRFDDLRAAVQQAIAAAHEPEPSAEVEGEASRAVDPSSAAPELSGPTRADWEAHKSEVRAQVLSLTGLSLPRYYQLRQLNRLCPEARELGATLTERHLRPVVVLPPEGQVLVIRAILAHQVPANKVPTLVNALRDGGATALRRALATLGLPTRPGRVSGVHTRLQGIPADWRDRVRLVEQELLTIKAPHARAARLAQIAQQLERLEGLAAAYRALLREYGRQMAPE